MLVLNGTRVKPLELLSASHSITTTRSTSSYMKPFWKLCPWTIPGLLLASLRFPVPVWLAEREGRLFLCSDRQSPSSVATEQLEPGSWWAQHHKDKAVLGEDWLKWPLPSACPFSFEVLACFHLPWMPVFSAYVRSFDDPTFISSFSRESEWAQSCL